MLPPHIHAAGQRTLDAPILDRQSHFIDNAQCLINGLRLSIPEVAGLRIDLIGLDFIPRNPSD